MSITPASTSVITKPINPNANFAANLAKTKNSDEQSNDAPLTDTVTFTQVSEGRTDNVSDEMRKLSDESIKLSDESIKSDDSSLAPTTLVDTPPIVSDQTDTNRLDHTRLGSKADALVDADTSRLSEAKNFGQYVSAIKRFLSSFTGSQAKTSDLLPFAFTGIDSGNTDSTTEPEASVSGHLDVSA